MDLKKNFYLNIKVSGSEYQRVEIVKQLGWYDDTVTLAYSSQQCISLNVNNPNMRDVLLWGSYSKWYLWRNVSRDVKLSVDKNYVWMITHIDILARHVLFKGSEIEPGGKFNGRRKILHIQIAEKADNSNIGTNMIRLHFQNT